MTAGIASTEGTDHLTMRRPSHVCTLTRINAKGLPPQRLYVVYRFEDGVAEPFVPLIQFFIDRGVARRLAWQRAFAGSVLLLLENLARHGSDASMGPTALQRFVDDLVLGSVDENGCDPAGLNWAPRSAAVVDGHLSRVTTFADWLSERTGLRPLNPWRQARPEERLVMLRRYETRSAHALIAAASYRYGEAEASRRARTVQTPSRARGAFEDVRAFAPGDFDKFLQHGWSKSSWSGAALDQRYRLRDLMITLLLHCGGLRVSEAFHIYVGDVIEDPNRPGHALVLLFHPEEGEAPEEPGGPWRDRRAYLSERWGLFPRTMQAGRFAAGWKNLALLDGRRRATQVFWFPDYWSKVFWGLYASYLRVRPSGTHPYLFVSERQGQRGEPYTIAAFEQAHARAVRRVGLKSGKNHGTSPHGHRHAFGLALTEAKLDRNVVQRSFHHRSASSQDVYTAMSSTKVTEALRVASERINAPFVFPALAREFGQ